VVLTRKQSASGVIIAAVPESAVVKDNCLENCAVPLLAGGGRAKGASHLKTQLQKKTSGEETRLRRLTGAKRLRRGWGAYLDSRMTEGRRTDLKTRAGFDFFATCLTRAQVLPAKEYPECNTTSA